jgi:hypothetical protein
MEEQMAEDAGEGEAMEEEVDKTKAEEAVDSSEIPGPGGDTVGAGDERL